MAHVDVIESRKNETAKRFRDKIFTFRYSALLERDKDTGKQIRITKSEPPVTGFLTDRDFQKEYKRQKELADEWEKKQRADYKLNHAETVTETVDTLKRREKITLSEFIDEWMENAIKKSVNKPNTPDTIAFYDNMSKDIKAYYKERIKLSEIGKKSVLDYLRYLQHDAKTKTGKPYSATTIYHHFSTLRSILEYAVYVDYIEKNPCKEIRKEDRPQRNHKEVEFLDKDESIRFLSCLESEKEAEYWRKSSHSLLFWKCLVNVLITTGLRRGELVGLQWGDIDRKNMMFRVQRNVTIDTSNKEESDPEKKIHVGQLKARDKNESRKVPFSLYLLELLDSYKAEQEAKFGASFLPNAYIFCRDNNPLLPIYPTEPTRLLTKFNKRHNLPNMSPHDLRHTAGYLAIESGANVKQIQALLGHKDPALSLKFYVGITDKAKSETVEGIESLLRPKKEEKQA